MKTNQAIVIGAGIGGLSAAISLARKGIFVRVLEVRSEPGGLASGFTAEGLSFDYGPYILLDRPGLEWAFEQFGEDLAQHLELRKIEHIYQVSFPNDVVVNFYADLDRTAAEFEKRWPGSAKKYIKFVEYTNRIYRRLSGLLRLSHPGPSDVLRSGAWRGIPFLLRSLQQVLARTELPSEIVNAVGIWTHVAGQSLAQAPSPLAFVPALFHSVGSYYPLGGIRRISTVLAQLARDAGVRFEWNCRVQKILTQGNQVRFVRTDSGEEHPVDIVVSNHSAIGTYIDLLDHPVKRKNEFEKIPLQSPGVCAYLAIRKGPVAPFLRFRLVSGNEPCRLFISPGVLTPEEERSGWYPARLLSPLRYADAKSGGIPGQQAYLEKILAESWWRELAGETRVVTTQIPAEWNERFHLYRDSMNPVMTAKFMRAGRMPHRSPFFKGLYFAGSSTHPGQWVSFCAISGVLAANCVMEDLPC